MSFSWGKVHLICRVYRNGAQRVTLRYHSSKVSHPAKDPDVKARTRFAPSPTGNLHLGSLRTALFCYLWAKRTGGEFILRIEDTDTQRTVENAEKTILNDLEWAGLKWDEYYRQSDRVRQLDKNGHHVYKRHAEQLVHGGWAYRCFCSPETLKAKASETAKLGFPPVYDGTCSNIKMAESQRRADNGEPYVIRFEDVEKSWEWDDVVHGKTKMVKAEPGSRIGDVPNDFIILKRDGWPTYHLASVIDDHEMKISHVIRGVEWFKSTPNHLALYNAFQWTPPAFVHVGLLRDANGAKLSKRDMRFDLEELKKTILPEALINYLALLGWKQPSNSKSEVFDQERLISSFQLDLSKTNPQVNFQKLLFLNTRHFKTRQKLVLSKDGAEPMLELEKLALASVRRQTTNKSRTSMGLDDEKLACRVHALLKSTKDFPSVNSWVAKNKAMISIVEPNVGLINIKGDLRFKQEFGEQEMDAAALGELVRQMALDSFHKNPDTWTSESIKPVIDQIISSLTKALKREQVTEEALRAFAMHLTFSRLRALISCSENPLAPAMVMLGRSICLDRIAHAQFKFVTEAEPHKIVLLDMDSSVKVEI